MIRPSATPPMAWDHEDLAKAAADLHRAAALNYPRLVEAGKVSADVAERTVRALASSAADRRRIADLYAGRDAGPRDDAATGPEKIAALEAALGFAERRWARAAAGLDQALTPTMRLARDGGTMTAEEMVALRRDGWPGWKDTIEVEPFLAAELHCRAVEALLWHQRRAGHPAHAAELHAALAASTTSRRAAA